MKVYKSKNVFDETLDRMRFLFNEFPNVIVNISGGKDSTVILNLALQVARELNRLPLQVLFTDQEAEWDAVIYYIRSIQANPEIKFYWLQVPIKISNANSHANPWVYCWKENDIWLREKEPDSIKENVYGTDRFAEMFPAFLKHHFPETKSCYIAGVRAEETPKRAIALTDSVTYKWITWGKQLDKKIPHCTFYPIYDWSYTDIWKAIYSNNWKYCKIYDVMYNYGVPVQAMRVSNVHHETAVRSLWYMQEFEPENYEKLTARVAGIDMAGKMGEKDYFPKKLPFMFKDWKEYRDYLLKNLIAEESTRNSFQHRFDMMDKKYSDIADIQRMYKVQVSSLVANDFTFVKMINWERSPEMHVYRKHKRGISVYGSRYSSQIKKEQQV